jgi:cellulose synthase/poly-beta-1,6-N-acetylglucosamine synthase-like glycosyltransferase
MDFIYIALAYGSILLTLQSAYSLLLMLYAWEDEERQERNRAPVTFDAPRKSFTLLLPARHEEAVIRGTIRKMTSLNYPRELVQILIIIEHGDHGTIAKVKEELAVLHAEGIDNARLITFSDPPINKPHGLNVALREATGDVVTIFDAEDEPHPDILRVVDTVMQHEGAPVVQCGVQLMNYADRWFSALNVLEYFFWFKSRMHYHASAGMVPLGGNTVFIRRDLLERLGGWDQYCLTEDADVGIRLSAADVPIRVLYEDHYVTREETPPTVGQFIKQRTRWNQGFMQVLAKKDWLRLPTWRQRLLALYTLGFPLLQALTTLYLPISLWLMLFAKVPVPIAMLSSLPLYMLLIQLGISLVGLYEFTAVHKLRPSPIAPLWLAVAYLPYQWLLGYAALRAAWRQLLGVNTWEKTQHVGAHRTSNAGSFPASVLPSIAPSRSPSGATISAGPPAFESQRAEEDSGGDRARFGRTGSMTEAA